MKWKYSDLTYFDYESNDEYDYEVRVYGDSARVVEYPKNQGKPLRHMDFRGVGYVEQAKDRCKIWSKQHG